MSQIIPIFLTFTYPTENSDMTAKEIFVAVTTSDWKTNFVAVTVAISIIICYYCIALTLVWLGYHKGVPFMAKLFYYMTFKIGDATQINIKRLLWVDFFIFMAVIFNVSGAITELLINIFVYIWRMLSYFFGLIF